VPAASVVVLRLRPLTGLLKSIVTAPIGAPVASVTMPWTVPAPPNSWARAAGTPASQSQITANAIATRVIRLTEAICIGYRDLIAGDGSKAFPQSPIETAWPVILRPRRCD
jgi:hypothetical protein